MGEERQARLEQVNRFCRYLAGRAKWVAAFNRMLHFHQILAVLLAENIEQHPQVVRDRFLSANSKYQILAISRSAHSKTIASAVTKEAELGHLAAFFRGRQELELYGKMNSNTAALGRREIGRRVDLKAT